MSRSHLKAGLKYSELVGAAGFEPATTRTPSVCATSLRHTPTRGRLYIRSRQDHTPVFHRHSAIRLSSSAPPADAIASTIAGRLEGPCAFRLIDQMHDLVADRCRWNEVTTDRRRASPRAPAAVHRAVHVERGGMHAQMHELVRHDSAIARCASFEAL